MPDALPQKPSFDQARKSVQDAVRRARDASQPEYEEVRARRGKFSGAKPTTTRRAYDLIKELEQEQEQKDAAAKVRERAEQQQRIRDEQKRRADEQKRRTDEQTRRADEQKSRIPEQRRTDQIENQELQKQRRIAEQRQTSGTVQRRQETGRLQPLVTEQRQQQQQQQQRGRPSAIPAISPSLAAMSLWSHEEEKHGTKSSQAQEPEVASAMRLPQRVVPWSGRPQQDGKRSPQPPQTEQQKMSAKGSATLGSSVRSKEQQDKSPLIRTLGGNLSQRQREELGPIEPATTRVPQIQQTGSPRHGQVKNSPRRAQSEGPGRGLATGPSRIQDEKPKAGEPARPSQNRSEVGPAGSTAKGPSRRVDDRGADASAFAKPSRIQQDESSGAGQATEPSRMQRTGSEGRLVTTWPSRAKQIERPRGIPSIGTPQRQETEGRKAGLIANPPQVQQERNDEREPRVGLSRKQEEETLRLRALRAKDLERKARIYGDKGQGVSSGVPKAA